MPNAETQVTLDKTIPAVRMVRMFAAPVAHVFRAHAERDLYAKWVGPHSLTTEIEAWSFRTGGEWKYAQRDDEGNAYAFYGSFHEVRRDERIVSTLTFVGFPDSVVIEQLTFEAVDGERCRLSTLSLFDSFEARDGMIESGMEQGVVEGYEKLDGWLASS